MRLEKLGEIAKIIAGQSPPSSSYNSDGKGVPFFQGKADYGEKYPTVRYWCTEPTKISYPEDILISMRAPVGPVNINIVESCIGRGLSAIRVNENVSRDYIYFWLKQNQHIIASKETGSTFKAITQKILNEIVVPFPSYLDQQHIANLLSKAETLINQRKETLHLLDEYLKSTFLEMFGDPVRNEKGWEKDKVFSYTDCIVPGRDKPKSFTGNVPWFTTEDLNHKGYVTKSKKNLGLSDEEISEVRAKVIPSGSVLMTCVGDLGVVSICKEDCVVNQQLHAFICKTGLNNLFLMFVLSFQTNFMYKKATSTTVPYMNKTTCNSIPIIIPPIHLQTQFAQIVEKTEALKTQNQQSLQELENLYNTLSQKAFRGDLSRKTEPTNHKTRKSLLTQKQALLK